MAGGARHDPEADVLVRPGGRWGLRHSEGSDTARGLTEAPGRAVWGDQACSLHSETVAAQRVSAAGGPMSNSTRAHGAPALGRDHRVLGTGQ